MAGGASHSRSVEISRLRSDARQNRERILRAARETFAARGIDAPLTSIARRAGVGIATLHRRFPTRDALVTATFAQQFERCNHALDEALADPDPWHGLCMLVGTIRVMQAADRGFTDAFFTRYPDAVDHARLTRAEAALTTLVGRCRQAGDVRPDVDADDIILALLVNAELLARLPGADRASARLVGHLLRAFAADPARPIPPPAALKLGPLLFGG